MTRGMKFWIGLSLANFVAIFILYYLYSNENPKVVFVKANVVFSEFEMTKELKSEYENTLGARKHILDSLQAVFRVATLSKDDRLAALVEQQYYRKKELFDEQNSDLTAQYDNQVWLRINQYVKEYCKDKHISYLHAFGEDSYLFYAEDKYNVTEEFLIYINNKYRGGIK